MLNLALAWVVIAVAGQAVVTEEVSPIELTDTLPPLRPLPVAAPRMATRESAAANRDSRHHLSGLTIGPRLAYYYYYERFPAAERALTEPVGYPVEGEPKSSEHGICEGLQLEYLAALPGDVVFLRPRLGGYLGLLHKYDGSTQGQLVEDWWTGDTSLVYEPVESRKSNFFLWGALDIGAGYLSPAWGIALWSGIELRLWSRHLDMLGRAKEYYYWASAPVGVLAYVDVSPKVRLGADAAATFFLAGNMAISEGGMGPSPSGIDWPAVHMSDSVSAAERLGVRVALPVQVRTGTALSLRITPWFEYYHFEKSNLDSVIAYDDYYYPPRRVSVVFYEPASRSFWWGLALDFVVHRRRYRS